MGPAAANIALFATPVRRPRILRIAILSPTILIGFIITVSFVVTAPRQNLQRIYSKRSPPGCFDRPAEGVDRSTSDMVIPLVQPAARLGASVGKS
jgi:hypothetical protein